MLDVAKVYEANVVGGRIFIIVTDNDVVVTTVSVNKAWKQRPDARMS